MSVFKFCISLIYICCLFQPIQATAIEEKLKGFDFSDTVMIFQKVEDKYSLTMLPSGSGLSDMDPNYHFSLLYWFLAKYGPLMLPLDLEVQEIQYQLIVVKPESETLFTIGDHVITNGELTAVIEDGDYKHIVTLLEKHNIQPQRLVTIDDVHGYAEIIKSHYDVLPKHPAYDGRPLQISTRRTELDDLEKQPSQGQNQRPNNIKSLPEISQQAIEIVPKKNVVQQKSDIDTVADAKLGYESSGDNRVATNKSLGLKEDVSIPSKPALTREQEQDQEIQKGNLVILLGLSILLGILFLYVKKSQNFSAIIPRGNVGK